MTDGSLDSSSTVLRANVDDPRFATEHDTCRAAVWTARDAVMAEVTDPVDTAATALGSRFGLEWVVEALFATLGSACERLLTR